MLSYVELQSIYNQSGMNCFLLVRLYKCSSDQRVTASAPFSLRINGNKWIIIHPAATNLEIIVSLQSNSQALTD